MYICKYGRMKTLHCTVERFSCAYMEHRKYTCADAVERKMTAQGTHGMDVMRCDGSEQHLLALSKSEPYKYMYFQRFAAISYQCTC